MATEAEQLETMKKSHDYFATAIQTLSTRVTYYHEEFQGVSNTIHFLSQLRDQLKSDIEKIEPPKPVEAKPLDMDLSYIKPAVEVELN